MKIFISGLVALLCCSFSVADMNAPGEGNITNDIHSPNRLPIRNVLKSHTTDTPNVKNAVAVTSSKNSYGTDQNAIKKNASRSGDPSVDCSCDAIYTAGDRVEATVDNPQGATNLPAGSLGTVLCGLDATDGLVLLIEWDNWFDGHDNVQYCECVDGSSAGTSSCYWVDCPDVTLYTPGSVDCSCDAVYSAGDRVEATVDNPQGAGNLPAGSLGTVLCGLDATDGLVLLIEWDNWFDGHDNVEYCECVDGSSAGTSSCYWVDCTDVTLYTPATGACCHMDYTCEYPTFEMDCVDAGGEWQGDGSVECDDCEEPDGSVDCSCDAIYTAGDRVEATVDNPQGATNLPAGSLGTVLCGDDGTDGLVLLIEWDNWFDGHDNVEYCVCVDGSSAGTSSCYWVDCTDVVAAGPLPCPEDINGDGTVDVSDLLQLIGAWGLCP